MGFILTLHGELRWLVVAVAIVALIKFGVGLARNANYTGMDRGLMSAYTILLDVNFLLGLVLLFGSGGGFTAGRIEHAVTMILALAAAHSSAMWRRSDDDAKKFRNNLLVLVLSLVLVVVGVVRLRGGWVFP